MISICNNFKSCMTVYSQNTKKICALPSIPTHFGWKVDCSDMCVPAHEEYISLLAIYTQRSVTSSFDYGFKHSINHNFSRADKKHIFSPRQQVVAVPSYLW
jgi:hypothetical protein